MRPSDIEASHRPRLGGVAKGFVMGVSAATATMLRAGQDTYARDLWAELGYDCVPKFIDDYDAKVIRKALRQWNKK